MELPLVDPTRCLAIGDCVTVCPTACLALMAQLPRLVQPTDCVECSLCVLVCPTQALIMAESPGVPYQ